ncbi:MAG: C_GCAxxG_C_C family protein [Clostridia bacterium]|nr:C_GCAxxG_C_C family protein [Clostridia bacterium]
MEIFDRLLDLKQKGFLCAQIMMQIALDTEGRENPELIRAIGGLNCGLGYTGGPCGALTSGCCVISYFAGKGEADETENPKLNDMIVEYVGWFEKEFDAAYGGHTCGVIMANDPEKKKQRCPKLIEASLGKVFEILQANDII